MLLGYLIASTLVEPASCKPSRQLDIFVRSTRFTHQAITFATKFAHYLIKAYQSCYYWCCGT